MFTIFLVKLSFDIVYESSRQSLNGQVCRKVACVHRRMEVMCTYMEVDLVHKERRIGL
jgi:hypothetical protein